MPQYCIITLHAVKKMPNNAHSFGSISLVGKWEFPTIKTMNRLPAGVYHLIYLQQKASV